MMDITDTLKESVNYFSLDHMLVYLFLLIMLVVGFLVGRANKDINEYALGGRSFATITLVITFLATAVGGGSTLGIATQIYADGIIMIVAGSGYFISYLLMAKLVAPKMERFEGCITLGDVMGQLYGERSRTVTAIIGFLFSILIVASQSLALGYVFESLLGMKRNTGIAIGGLTVVAYSALGGIKSVVITDVIQF
ncbi:MAG: hypothetical protein MI674_04410, partial [Cytophagales bacterium]|nr:hypothetical protein [Cytophagales bacterium]